MGDERQWMMTKNVWLQTMNYDRQYVMTDNGW